MTTPSRNKIFISYSHSDKKWLQMLKLHLDLYVSEEQAYYWDDTKIKAGDNWMDEIQNALGEAKVAVLLVSKTFLTSKFIGKHEVPVIKEAFQANELRIFWIAIGYSGYMKTWLKDRQAANKPDVPLETLPSYECDKILLEICEQIDQVMNASPVQAESPPQTKGKTRTDFIRCNRTRYLHRYRGFLNASLKDRPNLPQVCVIFGKLGQSHDNLVERMHREVIAQLATLKSTSSTRQGILFKQQQVRWPEPSDALEAQKEFLLTELSDVYAEQMLDYPSTFPASTLAGLSKLSQYKFVTVRHELHLGEGASADWGAFVPALTWYLQNYWAELASILESSNATQSWPQFLIFIKFTYKPAGFLGKLGLPGGVPFDKELVKANLAEIVQRTNILFPCMLLDELVTPTYPEVIRWYTDNDIYDTEQDRLEAAIKLYEQFGEDISMGIIERELRKCLSR
jgi:hypothetical protein